MHSALLVAILALGTAQRDAAAATLAGRVVEQESARPLPDVIVAIQAADGSRRREEITNADGQFVFSGVEPGTYAVWARPDDHRSTHLAQAFGEAAPLERGETHPPAKLTVKRGEPPPALEIALMRALAIEGRVLDQWDEPMANVNVAAARVETPQLANAVAVTDDRGMYRLFGLTPGAYHVCARPERYAIPDSAEPARYTRTCHPASIVESQSAAVALTARDATNIDVRPQGLRSYTVSGTLLDAAGAPADGAHVLAMLLEDESGSSYTRSKAGAFELTGVTPGRYLIVATIGGPQTPDDRRPPARERETGFASIDVTSGDVNGIAVTTSRDVTLKGRVVFDEPRPPAAAKPLKIAVQTRRIGRGMWRLERPPVTAVGPGLTFELTGVDRQPLVIGVWGLPAGVALRSVQHEGRDITGIPTTFSSGAAASPLTIMLTTRVAQPSIRILDDRGSAVTRGYVVVFSADAARWAGGWSAEPAQGGAVTMPAMPAGDYLVTALSVADFLVMSRDPDRIPDVAAAAVRMTFDVGDRKTYDLTLAKVSAR